MDDAFLMLGAWRTSDPRLSVERRMGIMMSDAGASITVTSLTNFGCFGNQRHTGHFFPFLGSSGAIIFLLVFFD